MFDGRDVIYCCDGSFDGLMCCVFTSFERRELPSAVSVGEPCQLALSELLHVPTDPEKAKRVISAMPRKISPNTEDLVKKAFLSCAENKDLLILTYLQKGFRYGGKIERMLADNTVNAVNNAVLHCINEAQKMKEFIRFSDFDGYLAAVIEPKNNIIPLIAAHFSDRYRNDSFLIYDKPHKTALMHYSHKSEIMTDIDFAMPPASADEERYRELWKGFYKTIGIEERYNPRCRMTHMPKRYWANMTEMQEETSFPDKKIFLEKRD